MLNLNQGIYTITCRTTKKKYVGSSCRLKIRLTRHKNALRRGMHHCSHLQRAWIKYGESDFEFALVEAVSTRSELLVREQHWIDMDRKSLFNTCMIAGSPIGMKLTNEQRDKISAALRGKPKTSEHRAALALGQQARVQRPEEQERIARFAVNRSGKKATLEHRANQSAGIRKALKNATRKTYGANSAARKCALGTAKFSCIKEAEEMTGLSRYKLKLHPDFSYLP